MNVSQPKTRSLTGPLVLIVIGVVFLFQNLAHINLVRFIKMAWPYWPVILIVLGISKLIEYFREHKVSKVA